jgi:hypothetical protein
MKFPTTVSLIVRVDVGDTKTLPGAIMQMGDQSYQHKFTQDKEQHKFTVTAELEPGDHPVELSFLDKDETQGSINILAMYVQGAPVGMHIYQCEYTQWQTGNTERSHLYMGRPGVWKINVKAPRGGVGFA